MKQKRYLTILLLPVHTVIYPQDHSELVHLSLSSQPSLRSVSAPNGSSYKYLNSSIEETDNGSTGQTKIKIRIDNGMQAYLISDPQPLESAAAVSVAVGSWNNPTID
ncbi:MAG: hypothetical protein EB051_01125 [Chlamydiia bacterium]|nr:hypothetical protein [Chlamydiia bacterium]